MKPQNADFNHIGIPELVLEVVQETLALAERQVAKDREISNLNSLAICQEILQRKESMFAEQDSWEKVWVSALIESSSSIGQSIEAREVFESVLAGSTHGSKRGSSGQYQFRVNTLNRFLETKSPWVAQKIA